MNEERKTTESITEYKHSVEHNDENIDELRFIIATIALLWKQKWWIVLGTTLFTIAGIFYVLRLEPIYTARAIIALKEADKSSAGILSQMGGLGGILAAQVGSGGTSLSHIVIIGKSHDLAEAIIKKHDLLPKLFHEIYDFEHTKWIVEDSVEVPTIKQGARKLSEKMVSISNDLKSNTITIKAEVYDSILVADIVSYYLQEIDDKLKKDVIEQAQKKKEYLEEQMRSTEDPWMLQKLQTLIGMEVEKTILVVGSSIKILESPMIPLGKSKPNKKLVVVMFFVGSFILCSTGVVLFSFIGKIYGYMKEMFMSSATDKPKKLLI